MLKILKYSQKVMKHTLLAFALLLALPLALSSFSTNAFVDKAFAAVFTVNGVQYQVLSISGSSGTVQVSGPNPDANFFDIPTTVTDGSNTYVVTAVGNHAFAGSSATTIRLGSSITSIGTAAFAGTTSLTSIFIPDSVTHIGESAFVDATSLTDISIPDSVTYIGINAFKNATALTSVTLSAGLTSISTSAFAGTSITSIDLPDGLTSIGSGAFAGTSLIAIDIPATVTSIGTSAFKDTDLTSITLPAGLTIIEAYTFSGTKLTSIDIPPSVTTIAPEAFKGSALTSIVIPATVTAVGDNAFQDCSQLTSVTILSENVPADVFAGTPFASAVGTSSTLAPGTYSNENGVVKFTPQRIYPQDYPDAQASSLETMNNILAVKDINSNVESIRFFSMLIDNAGIGTKNPKEVVRILESVLRVDQVAAVSNMGIGASFSASNNVINYLSQAGVSLALSGGQAPVIVRKDESLENEFLQDALLQEGMAAGSLEADESIKNGLALWLLPMYKYSRVSGISVGAFEHGYDSSLGGMSLGADYTFDNAFRVGLAFNLGTGSAESTGDLSKTDSDFDFWGLSLYGAYYKDKFSLMADIGYSAVKGESSQEVPAILGSSSLEADTDSDVWTLGLTTEYIFETKFMDIRPHAGIRYMNIDVADYDTKNTAGIIAQTKSKSQDVWYFPVGVTFSADFESESNWVFTPSADLGFIAAAGDLDATSISTIPGVAGSTKSTMQTVDDFAFSGGVGLNLANKDKGISFGFNYNIQASKHETGHLFNASFRYDF